MVRVCPNAKGWARCQTGRVQPSAAILIVDDHDGFLTFARGTLEPAGFMVAEAAGSEAADVARTIRPGWLAPKATNAPFRPGSATLRKNQISFTNSSSKRALCLLRH